MGNTCCAEQKEQVAEHVEKAVEQAQEIAEDVKEAVADAAEQAQETIEDVKEGMAEVAEAAAETMTAAMALAKGVMIVEFDVGKGSIQTVEFKSKVLGLTPARGGAGCCASAPKASVVVSKVDKNCQADKLGVKKGWAVKAINGTEVTGLEEARRLLEEGAAKISEA